MTMFTQFKLFPLAPATLSHSAMHFNFRIDVSEKKSVGDGKWVNLLWRITSLPEVTPRGTYTRVF